MPGKHYTDNFLVNFNLNPLTAGYINGNETERRVNQNTPTPLLELIRSSRCTVPILLSLVNQFRFGTINLPNAQYPYKFIFVRVGYKGGKRAKG
jgi:hypothetical protein